MNTSRLSADHRRQSASLASAVAFARGRGGRFALWAGTGVAAACFGVVGASQAHAVSDAGNGGSGSSGTSGMSLSEKKELAQIQREQADKAAAAKAKAPAPAPAKAKAPAPAPAKAKPVAAAAPKTAPIPVPAKPAAKSASGAVPPGGWPGMTGQEKKELAQIQREQAEKAAAAKAKAPAPAPAPAPAKAKAPAPAKAKPVAAAAPKPQTAKPAAKSASNSRGTSGMSLSEKKELAQIQREQADKAAAAKAAAAEAKAKSSTAIPVPAKPAAKSASGAVPPGGWSGMTGQEKKELAQIQREQAEKHAYRMAHPETWMNRQELKELAEIKREQAAQAEAYRMAHPETWMNRQELKELAQIRRDQEEQARTDAEYRRKAIELDKHAAAQEAANRAAAKQKPVQMDRSAMTPHERMELDQIERDQEAERQRKAREYAASPVGQLEALNKAKAEAKAREAAQGKPGRTQPIELPPQSTPEPSTPRPGDLSFPELLPGPGPWDLLGRNTSQPGPTYTAMAAAHERQEEVQIARDRRELESAANDQLRREAAARELAALEAKMTPEQVVAARQARIRAANGEWDATDGFTAQRVSPRQPTGAELQAERDRNWKPTGMVHCVGGNGAYGIGAGFTGCRGSDFTVEQYRLLTGLGWTAGYDYKETAQAGTGGFGKASVSAGGGKVGGEISSQARADGTTTLNWKASATVGVGPASEKAEVSGSHPSNGPSTYGLSYSAGVGPVSAQGTVNTAGQNTASATVEFGSFAGGGLEHTVVQRDTLERAAAQESQMLAEYGVVLKNAKGQTPTEEFEANRAAQRQELQAEVDRQVNADNRRLMYAYQQSHPEQVAPSAVRLRLDRWARANDVDTTSQVYRGGGWQDAAYRAGLDRDQVEELRRENNILF